VIWAVFRLFDVRVLFAPSPPVVVCKILLRAYRNLIGVKVEFKPRRDPRVISPDRDWNPREFCGGSFFCDISSLISQLLETRF
jgi:hypothetical protein